ncbi:MAG: TIGR02588 family protein [Alphaproteobacteria bacterium]|nr:TIGR02588 family protein [Rhizobiaceae bacterium]MBU3963938.1 TIGR02588 family protein [Alphaproteobacteria bacterium]MBU4049936.1 TIGR02588 family protein [Alphaproteobacteria bacterium]MBU4090838.1 TIGR02588 family protein [Alphaproteobacteria bacterium]MBU4155243.1 TIGR02588 family protein [Alphaproteobacteria bacterium]
MSPSRHPLHTEADDPHWMEWLTGLISLILIALLIGYVSWSAMTEQMEPPEFAIEATGMEHVPGGYRITFDIENRANSTAAAVTVRGELKRGEESVESVDVTFDYVPGQSQSSGAILFLTDPGSAQLTLRAIGYTDP